MPGSKRPADAVSGGAALKEQLSNLMCCREPAGHCFVINGNVCAVEMEENGFSIVDEIVFENMAVALYPRADRKYNEARLLGNGAPTAFWPEQIVVMHAGLLFSGFALDHSQQQVETLQFFLASAANTQNIAEDLVGLRWQAVRDEEPNGPIAELQCQLVLPIAGEAPG